ncbi:MAG: MBL fold metallo-hydrolase [Chloroflexi bacterium]|nr:MBL fold metallo-hydrolase [Chloroflexota bacterium]
MAPGVHQLHAIGARVTALFDSEGVLLVDAGGKGSLPLIAAGLKAIGTSLQEVHTIVLTHYHPDHTGELAKLVEASAAKVAAHRQEAGIVGGIEPSPNPFNNPVLAGVTQPFLPLLSSQPVAVSLLLVDGQQLPTLGGVRVIHAPGHTRGSICLHVPSRGVLIVGDALCHRFRRLSPPAREVTWDPHQAAASMKRLMDFDFESICFSHYPPLRQGGRQALARLLDRMDAEPSRIRG